MSVSSGPDAGGPAPLRVGSYNVHGCVGADARYDPARVAAVIRELDCQAVGLQEVDGLPGVESTPKQIERLSALTGLAALATVAPATPPAPVRKTNVLLTSHEARSVLTHDLTFESREPRSALDVELSVAGGTLRVIVTHLGLRGVERRYQVRKLLEVLVGIPLEQRVIVLGDMNEWLPFARPLRWLHTLLGKTPAARSFPVWAPALCLDRIWSRPHADLRAFAVHDSPTARWASDHYPVTAWVGGPI